MFAEFYWGGGTHSIQEIQEPVTHPDSPDRAQGQPL